MDGHGTDATNEPGADRAPVRLLGIGGSTRRESRSLAVLETALRLAEVHGAQTALADVRAMDLPLFAEDGSAAEQPPALRWLLQEVRMAEAYVLCSPTYHGTLSGAVKNALDALTPLGEDEPPYLAGRPVGLIALGGAGAANTLTALHHAARALGGLTVPTVVVVPSKAVDVHAREVVDQAVRRRLATMTHEVIHLAPRLRSPAPVPLGIR